MRMIQLWGGQHVAAVVALTVLSVLVSSCTPEGGALVQLSGLGVRTSGPAACQELPPVRTLAVSSGGTVYFVGYSTAGDRIFKVAKGVLSVAVAGTGAWGFSGDGGPAKAATFREPRGSGSTAPASTSPTPGTTASARSLAPPGSSPPSRATATPAAAPTASPPTPSSRRPPASGPTAPAASTSATASAAPTSTSPPTRSPPRRHTAPSSRWTLRTTPTASPRRSLTLPTPIRTRPCSATRTTVPAPRPSRAAPAAAATPTAPPHSMPTSPTRSSARRGPVGQPLHLLGPAHGPLPVQRHRVHRRRDAHAAQRRGLRRLRRRGRSPHRRPERRPVRRRGQRLRHRAA